MLTDKQRAAIDRAVEREQAKERAVQAREQARIAAALADPAKAMRLLLRRLKDRRRSLLDPNTGHNPNYPEHKPGMSTAEYIRLYQAANLPAFTGGNLLTFKKGTQ